MNDQHTMDLDGRNVVVVGLGRTGAAAAEFLLKKGSRVVVTDPKPYEALAEQADALEEKGAVLELGGHNEKTFTGADLIVLSPGVPPFIPPLKAAAAEGVPITGEIELAAGFLKQPMIAVTGTNGKTTTTTLIGDMIKACSRRVFVGGNIGAPLIEIVDRENHYDYIVIELSSFQLETAKRLKPNVAALLNVTPDHMDRYPDPEDYFRSKAKIFARQNERDFAVLNADDPLVSSIVCASRKLYFSRGKQQENGAYLAGDRIVMKFDGQIKSELPLADIAMRGAHNQENIMAAMLSAAAMGFDPETLRRTAGKFKGLPHRVEYVRTHKGVNYYDDSKGTNVGAVIKSLEGFDEPVILIAGGRDKDLDFAPLKRLVKEKVKLLILLGEARHIIFKALGNETETIMVDSMNDAVSKADAYSEPGDVVLLSPACASFDMFNSYAHRGDVFSQLVWSLTE